MKFERAPSPAPCADTPFIHYSWLEVHKAGELELFWLEAIAEKIIELAKAGERNPDLLWERALNNLREPPPQD